jgi:hypothetical protein
MVRKQQPKNNNIERLVLQNPARFYPQKSYLRARIKFCALYIFQKLYSRSVLTGAHFSEDILPPETTTWEALASAAHANV